MKLSPQLKAAGNMNFKIIIEAPLDQSNHCKIANRNLTHPNTYKYLMKSKDRDKTKINKDIPYLRTSSLAPSFPEISKEVRLGRHRGRRRRLMIANFPELTLTNGCIEESSDTSKCTNFVNSHNTGTTSSWFEATRLYIDRDFRRSLHFLKGDMSSIWVLDISRFTRQGRSSTMISSPCLLNSVLLTFKLWRLCSLDSDTTTQNFVLFTNVLLLTFKDFRLDRVHSPRQPMTSFTVAVRSPMISSSEILWLFKILKPFAESWASLMDTLFKFVTLGSNRLKVSSVNLPFSQRVCSSCSDSSPWKKMSGSLKASFFMLVFSVAEAVHRSCRWSLMKSMQHSCRLVGMSYILNGFMYRFLEDPSTVVL